MEQDPGGGSDVVRDLERELGDEPPALIRDSAPDYLAPIDASAPGQRPPAGARIDVVAGRRARARLDARPRPRSIRRSGRSGRRAWPLDSIDRETLAARAGQSHAQPLLDAGPAELPVVYTIDAGAFDIIVNGDHLLAWGVEPAEIQDAAMRNLAAWSAGAPWTDEVSGERRLHQLGHREWLGRGPDPAARGDRPPDGRARARRPDPRRAARAASHDGRLAATRRRRLRGAVRRLHRRAVRAAPTSRSTGASSSSSTAGSSSSRGSSPAPDGGRTGGAGVHLAALRGRRCDRDDHARPARGAERADRHRSSRSCWRPSGRSPATARSGRSC